MRRDQLEHAIRTACQIIGHPAVGAAGFEDPQPEQAEHGHQGEVVGVA